MDIYKFNNRLVTIGGKFLSPVVEPPGPTDEVQIGNQIWKTKNLAIDDGQGGIYTKTVNYGQGDVVEYYYTWDAAVRVAASISGWHLPTASEWDILATEVGGSSIAGSKLKSTYSWNNDGNGTDDYGFTVLPAGYWYSGEYYGFGTLGYFWTATTYSSTMAYGRRFSYANSKYAEFSGYKTGNYPVRLVKDAS